MDYSPQKVNLLPNNPGIYFFKNKEGTILYIGKAINLKRRVCGYFTRDSKARDKTRLLVSQIQTITTIETANNFDALLLEATLIRKHKPKYNIIAKDDKSALYIGLTLSDELPRVLFLRKTALSTLRPSDAIFGPFQSSRVARMLMKRVRLSIPYCLQKKRNGKPCFYTHIGLCHPCPSEISALPFGKKRKILIHSYRVNIHRIHHILSGTSDRVIKDLQKDMERKAYTLHFEEAKILKKSLDGLVNLLSHHDYSALYVSDTPELTAMHKQELVELQKILIPYFSNITYLMRIECYDMSHLSGTFATGSLVVATHGQMDSSQYRKFRIRSTKSSSDTAMIQEVISRRLKHILWPYPNLVIIDGGKGQVQTVQTTLASSSLTIPVIGLAKRYEEIIVSVSTGFKIIRLPLTSPALVLLQHIRDEAHRFARSYHHLLRKKSFVPV